MISKTASVQQCQEQCNFFFELPSEIQLMIMGHLDLHELLGAKLVSRSFQALANDDQLWKQLTLLASIPDHILEEARETQRGTAGGVFVGKSKHGRQCQWQHLLKTSTMIIRENDKRVEGTFSQMRIKIDLVRQALEQQTQDLEQTHQRLSLLSTRLHQMEEQNRVRDLERLRAQERENQRLEDEKWIRAWDALSISEKEAAGMSSDAEQVPEMPNIQVNRGNRTQGPRR